MSLFRPSLVSPFKTLKTFKRYTFCCVRFINSCVLNVLNVLNGRPRDRDAERRSPENGRRQ
jgi:hypothetical protein